MSCPDVGRIGRHGSPTRCRMSAVAVMWDRTWEVWFVDVFGVVKVFRGSKSDAKCFFQRAWMPRILLDLRDRVMEVRGVWCEPALRFLRREMQSFKSERDQKARLKDVGIHVGTLTGRAVDMTMPETATIDDVKLEVERTLGIERMEQRIVSGTSLVDDHEVISSLKEGDRLELSVVVTTADEASITEEFVKISDEIERTRAKEVCSESRTALVALLEKRDRLELMLR